MGYLEFIELLPACGQYGFAILIYCFAVGSVFGLLLSLFGISLKHSYTNE